MDNLFFFANNVYQFSNAIPIHRQLGGTFIVKKPRHVWKFKKYFRNHNHTPGVKTFLNAPPVIVRNPSEQLGIKGVVISDSNKRLYYNDGECKSVFLGHGTGDKKYGGSTKSLESYDYHFIAGPKHMAKLKDVGVDLPDERLIKVGNLRFDDYVNDKIDRKKVLDQLGVKDRTRPTILYAPTWRWGNGTLMKYGFQFCKELTRDYNLIIRPHYHDRDKMMYIKYWAMLRGIRHVYFSNPRIYTHNDTLEIFRVSDLMISDTSSIVYEYLITKNPIIIALNEYQDLHNMPSHLDVKQLADKYDGTTSITDLVAKNLARADQSRGQYEELLHNCFYFNDGRCTERAVEFLQQLKL